MHTCIRETGKSNSWASNLGHIKLSLVPIPLSLSASIVCVCGNFDIMGIRISGVQLDSFQPNSEQDAFQDELLLLRKKKSDNSAQTSCITVMLKFAMRIAPACLSDPIYFFADILGKSIHEAQSGDPSRRKGRVVLFRIQDIVGFYLQIPM